MGAAHRTPTTCHLHRFASSGHPVRVRRSAGRAGVEDGCHVSRPASIWDLRLAVWSWHGRGRCIPPLSSLRRRIWRHAPWPLGHVHSASRRPPHEHTAQREKKRALKRRDSGNVAVVIATQKGAVRALDGRKEERPQFAAVLLRHWAVTTPPRPMHTARLRPHIARRSCCGDWSLSAMCRLRARRFPFFVWR